MHTKTLAPHTKEILNQIASLSFLKTFYLSGGTALALHLGHRESEDLDFFSKTDFDPARIQMELEKITKITGVEQDKGTLNCHASSVQLQFLHYPYNLLNDAILWNQIQIASIEDIACTKLLTIGSRGSKKDFIDIYFILKQYTLSDLFKLLQQKYPSADYNQIHILKSLVYFDDANNQVMPRMHLDVTWDQVKSDIVSTVKSFKL